MRAVIGLVLSGAGIFMLLNGPLGKNPSVRRHNNKTPFFLDDTSGAPLDAAASANPNLEEQPAPPLPPGQDPPPGIGWDHQRSQWAQDYATRDNAGANYCAKGVANILSALNLPVTRGHAYTWKNSLVKNGWTRINATPDTAPPGAVLVFDRTPGARNGGGAQFGHVEIVTSTGPGQRAYVSDATRTSWGGSVPQNFVGAYVYTR